MGTIIEVGLKQCYKPSMKRAAIEITGIVQGIGFRPFIYNLAQTHSIRGWVLNNEQGVFVDAESEDGNLDQFIRDIPALAPPLARIESFKVKHLEPFVDLFKLELVRYGV